MDLHLIIPVENQVRELDPKLLLACVAAQRGFASIIGFRRQLHFHVGAFPRGVYLSKSITPASDLMFRILHRLGHKIAAWDEEALVHLPPETYFSRRLSPDAMSLVSHFFAWGEDNAELWRQYPRLPAGARIHVTGNPRSDMLRPELHPFYREEVAQIRKAHGDFILVNTNFNHVNAFSPVQNLFQPTAAAAGEAQFGRAAKGMSRTYAQGLHAFKLGVFHRFQEMIPALEKAFPDCRIVVRPHPTESQDPYRLIARGCGRVTVTNEGNVVPWLLATRALVHNSCTTGAEAYIMRVPAVSYRAHVDERYEFGFYRLPNSVSHQCFTFEELERTLGRILAGELGAYEGDGCDRLARHYLAALQGPLACERMIDVVAEMAADAAEWPEPGALNLLAGRAMAAGRMAVKLFKARLPGSHNRPEFQKHRYPEVSLQDIQARVDRFRDILGMERAVRAEPVLESFFKLHPES